jgi:glutamate carboxypeptidase
MLGHSDTVWPVGTLEHMPVHLHDGKLFGPGAYDMKGGIVQIIFALDALRALQLEPAVTPVALITTDEEVGSPESERHIRLLARVSDRAFVLEPPLGPLGKLKTARKGNGSFEIRVSGKAAHGVTINVGTIDGGLRTNVVAPTGHATVDVRVQNPEDAVWVQAQILGMQPQTPGTRLEITGGMKREPMIRTTRNQRLWLLAQRAAAALGLEIDQGTSGGGSDGNITSLYTATLDGLGPVGDGAHAEHEHVVVETLPERAALLAMLLLEPKLGREPGDRRGNRSSPGAGASRPAGDVVRLAFPPESTPEPL